MDARTPSSSSTTRTVPRRVRVGASSTSAVVIGRASRSSTRILGARRRRPGRWTRIRTERPGGTARQRLLQAGGVLHGLAVDLEDDVAALEAGAVGGTACWPRR